ncbi:MAG TPA: ABC transporter permease [Streptosporangiaceae bacterium]|nr:ABC transporter permease [Streptosporangiaceae bacterium]
MAVAAATLPVATPATRTTSIGVSTMQIAKRSLLRYMRTPQLIVLGTIQGAMFLLIFRYVFGGAIPIKGGIPYVDFLVPGFITTGVLFSGMAAAAGAAEDLQQGFVDRLRSLPVPRFSFLTGRAVADTVWNSWGLVITALIGFAVGFRLHASVLDGLAALGLCVVFGFAFEWLFIMLGLMAGTPQAAQGLALLVFPFTFVSSAYIPVSSMPGWMQAFASHQPITYMVDAVRALSQGHAAEALIGHSTGYLVSGSLLWALGFVVVFGPLAALRYRRS